MLRVIKVVTILYWSSNGTCLYIPVERVTVHCFLIKAFILQNNTSTIYCMKRLETRGPRATCSPGQLKSYLRLVYIFPHQVNMSTRKIFKSACEIIMLTSKIIKSTSIIRLNINACSLVWYQWENNTNKWILLWH